ncbi:MAG TPA: FAD binding domain-containing protein [Burkholderiaceae bacterium]|nr:FAD binding domain-containing protein [Burkholderiaceae bacterium]
MYRQPHTVDDALAALAAQRLTVLAGGTDLYPACVGKPLPDTLLDISRIDALRSVASGPGGALRIGALTTWSQLLRMQLPAPFAALAQAAREIGGVQIQNQGTIGGNLCNASPAADGTPVLLALDAQVELASARGVRQLPIDAFVLGNRRTAREPDELLIAVTIPPQPAAARSCFLKLGHRRYLVISIASVALRFAADEHGSVRDCAIAVGACSAAPRRLPALERALNGFPLREAAARAQRALRTERERMLEPLAPIDDVRGTARYRIDAVATLIERAVAELAA